MPDPTHTQETELQTRKVAALERYIAQIDLDLRFSREIQLTCEKARKEYVQKLQQEREYLDWLNAPCRASRR